MPQTIHDTDFTGTVGAAPDPTLFEQNLDGQSDTEVKIYTGGSRLFIENGNDGGSPGFWVKDPDTAGRYDRTSGDWTIHAELLLEDRFYLNIYRIDSGTAAEKSGFQARLNADDEWEISVDGVKQSPTGANANDDVLFSTIGAIGIGDDFCVRQVWGTGGIFKIKVWLGLPSAEPGGVGSDTDWALNIASGATTAGQPTLFISRLSGNPSRWLINRSIFIDPDSAGGGTDGIAPVLGTVADVTVEEGQTATRTATATDDAAVTFTLTGSTPAWVTISGATITLAPTTGDAVGSPYTVEVTATSTDGTDVGTFAATVTEPPPGSGPVRPQFIM